MIVYFRRFIICAFLLTASSLLALDPGRAITQYGVRTWRSEDGLPQNAVYAIAQAPDGYLWFATAGSLARFDGVQFNELSHLGANRLPTSFVRALMPSRDGSLWLGLGRGLAQYRNGQFKTFTTSDGLRDPWVMSLAEGPDGSLWVGTYAGWLHRFKGGKFTAYPTAAGKTVWKTFVARDGAVWIATNGSGAGRFFDGKWTYLTSRDGLANDIVWSVYQDRAGDIWIGTNSGLNRLRDGKITTFTTADGLSSACVKTILEDRDGNLWIGTEGGGLNRYANGKFTTLGTDHGLADASVQSLHEDHEGSLWVGTAGGLNQLRDGKIVTIDRSEGLVGARALAVRQARDGALLIGTNDGFSRWKDGKMTSLTRREGLSSNVVRSVIEDRDGSLWLATNDGLNHYRDGKMKVYRIADGLPHDMIRSLMQDRRGDLWIGTRAGLVRHRDGVFTVFDTRDGLPNSLILMTKEDAEGRIWIATNGGVGVLDPGNGKFRGYGLRDGLSHENVLTIHHDRDGGHWIGTFGGGLNRIKNGRITPITSANGLFDDIVFAILEDDAGSLWMTCNRGIFRVSRKELDDFADGRIKRVHSESFGVADGMKDAECNDGDPSGWKGTDGRLYIPTSRGVAVLDPAMTNNSVAPSVWNESVLVDGKPVAIREGGLTIAPGRHTLEIRYTALSFIAPKKVAFRYRLRGFNKEWTDAGNRRTAYYTNVPPGDYTFEVRGSNGAGVWSAAGNPISIRVEAAFHQTWWFWIVIAISLFLAIRLGFRMRLRIVQDHERELAQRVDEQTAELSAAKVAAERAAEINSELSRRKQLILNSAAEGIFGVDSHGVATFINPSAARMLGRTVPELVGRNLHELIHAWPDDEAAPQQRDCVICSDTVQPATRFGRNLELRRFNGSTFPVEFTASAMVNEWGVSHGVVVTFRDITEDRKIEILKEEFVSTVSHELRSPMTSIRGALGLLSSGLLGNMDPKAKRMLDVAVINTDRLVRLVNDILDQARIDSGRLELVRAPNHAHQLMTQAAESVQAIADQAGVAIIVEPIDAVLSVDGDRILQTLTNLLSNAIKFSSPGGRVTVGGSMGDGCFVFRVADQGRGIPEDMIEKIFDRFRQVDASDRRAKGGTGLGLAICRSIVDGHGGRIWAESSPEGSVFQFTIPLPLAA